MRPALTNALTNAIRSAFSYTANNAEQWVAQLDGAMQSWVLQPPRIFNSDFSVSINLNMPSNGFSGAPCIMGANNTGVTERKTFVVYLQSGKIRTQIPTQNGTKYGLSADIPPTSFDKEVKFTLARVGTVYSIYIDSIEVAIYDVVAFGLVDIEVYALGNWAGLYWAGYLSNYLEVTEETHEIPLNNKAQGATQLATVGNVNAFMPNYTNAVWRKP